MSIKVIPLRAGRADVTVDGRHVGFVERHDVDVYDRPGHIKTLHGWRYVLPSQMAQWSAGDALMLPLPTRRAAVSALAGM
ncbi:hypothetical protein [Tsukamurella soli]|uniref:DUF2171 domain-containing protein n=1 Tax=Tsukamurella soli TaxID=644556 RepID=A0ABP8JKE0_9ACTN